MIIICLVVFLLPVILALQVIVIKRYVGRTKHEETEEAAARSKTGGESKKQPASVDGSEAGVKDDPGTAPPPPNPLMEVLGGLSCAHLYQSYLNIGFLADAVEGKLYTKERARSLLESVTRTLKEADKQMARIASSSREESETRYLVRVKKLNALLETQTSELRKYWDNGKKEHADAYSKARSEAWTGLEALLDGSE